MSLNRQPPALIEQGWIRALILVLVYIAFSVVWSNYTWSAELWFTASFILSFLLVFLFRRLLDRRSFESLGFSTAHFYPDAVIGFAIGSFLICTGAVTLYYLNYLRWIDVIYSSNDLLLSLAILTMIAFSEELIFRGYVLRNLMKSFNKWVALFVSAVLFSIVHYSNVGIPFIGHINTFLGGLVLGITFIVTRSLWMPIFFHLSWNFIQGPVLGFKVSGVPFDSILSMEPTGPAILTGGEYGFEGSVICTIVLSLALAVGCYLESKKTYE